MEALGIGQLTLVVSEFAGDADNAKLLGGDACVFAEKSELVPHLDDEDGVHVLPFDVQKLHLHGRELARLGSLLLALGRCRRLLVLLVVTVRVFAVRVARVGISKVAPPNHDHAVWVPELLDELFVQRLLCTLGGDILVRIVVVLRVGRTGGIVGVELGPGTGRDRVRRSWRGWR